MRTGEASRWPWPVPRLDCASSASDAPRAERIRALCFRCRRRGVGFDRRDLQYRVAAAERRSLKQRDADDADVVGRPVRAAYESRRRVK